MRYDHKADEALAAHAQAGRQPAEAFILLHPPNAMAKRCSTIHSSIQFLMRSKRCDHPRVVIGLGDSGAHVGQIMDASLPTYFLKYWVKERQHFTLAQAIRKLTLDLAHLFGIQDRGVIRQGAYADLNVIDYDNLRLPPPTFVTDLPANGSRYIQKSSGYKYTLVNGQVFMEGLDHTGTLAGQVLRSA